MELGTSFARITLSVGEVRTIGDWWCGNGGTSHSVAKLWTDQLILPHSSMSIEHYKTDLAPLLHGFKDETVSYRDSKRTFTDEFGNSICFNYGKRDVIKLINDPSLITVEVRDIDKGYLSYTVYQHADSYFILYQTRCDLDGWCGHFRSFVVVPSLDVIAQFLDESDKKRKAEEDAFMAAHEAAVAAQVAPSEAAPSGDSSVEAAVAEPAPQTDAAEVYL